MIGFGVGVNQWIGCQTKTPANNVDPPFDPFGRCAPIADQEFKTETQRSKLWLWHIPIILRAVASLGLWLFTAIIAKNSGMVSGLSIRDN